MTHHQHICKYILTNGSITPSHVANTDWGGKRFGSECAKRCRELRARGILINPLEDGKENDEKFIFSPLLPKQFNILKSYAPGIKTEEERQEILL